MADDLAVVIPGTSPQQVETFLRADTPDGYRIAGRAMIRRSALSPGWTMVEPEPQPAPESITPWQLRTWLLQRRGVTPDQVLALLTAISDPIARAQAMIDWDYPSEIRRDHPLIGTLGAALGLSAGEVDQAFREAAGLV